MVLIDQRDWSVSYAYVTNQNVASVVSMNCQNCESVTTHTTLYKSSKVQKLEAKIQLLNNESGATSVAEMKRDAAPVSWPVRQQVNEVMEIDKRKDNVVISGIKEGEDAQVRVDEILHELGYMKPGQVVDRVGRLNDAKKDKNSSRKDRLVRGET